MRHTAVNKINREEQMIKYVLFGIMGLLALFYVYRIVLLFTYKSRNTKKENAPPPKANVLRVACVGDSLTYGAMLRDPNANSYPARMAQLLGEGFDVRNFGASGACIQRFAEKSYWASGAYRQSREYLPDAVIVMLGTNDTKDANWNDIYRLMKDCYSLLTDYALLSSHPLIYVLTPPPLFAAAGKKVRYTLNSERLYLLCNELREAAREHVFEIIDINAMLEGRRECYMDDGVHLNERGYEIIAQTVSQTLMNSERAAIKIKNKAEGAEAE